MLLSLSRPYIRFLSWFFGLFGMDVVGFEFRGLGWSLPISNGLQWVIVFFWSSSPGLLILQVHFVRVLMI